MSDFPVNSVIRLARDSKLEDQPVTIEGNNATGFDLVLAGEGWTFKPGALSTDGCTLSCGTNPSTSDTLDVTGSCSKKAGSTSFEYIIGITEDPSGPPDNHVVEWVAEDDG